MNLELIDFQGEVLIYGSHSELVERGVDTKQLLGLIKEGDEKEKKNEFSYEDADIEESTVSDWYVSPEEQKCNNLHANVFCNSSLQLLHCAGNDYEIFISPHFNSTNKSFVTVKNSCVSI